MEPYRDAARICEHHPGAPLCHLAPGTVTPSYQSVCIAASHCRRAGDTQTLPDMCHRWHAALSWVLPSDDWSALQVLSVALTACQTAHSSLVMAGQDDAFAGQLVAPTKPDLVELPAGAGRGAHPYLHCSGACRASTLHAVWLTMSLLSIERDLRVGHCCGRSVPCGGGRILWQ